MQPKNRFNISPWGKGGRYFPGMDNPWSDSLLTDDEDAPREQVPAIRDLSPGIPYPPVMINVVEYIRQARQTINTELQNEKNRYANPELVAVQDMIELLDRFIYDLDQKNLSITLLDQLEYGIGGKYSTLDNSLTLTFPPTEPEAMRGYTATFFHEYVHYVNDLSMEQELLVNKMAMLKPGSDMIADERRCYVAEGFYESILKFHKGERRFSSYAIHHVDNPDDEAAANSKNDAILLKEKEYIKRLKDFPQFHYLVQYNVMTHPMLYSVDNTAGEAGRHYLAPVDEEPPVNPQSILSYDRVLDLFIEKEMTHLQAVAPADLQQVHVHIHNGSERVDEYVYSYETLLTRSTE